MGKKISFSSRKFILKVQGQKQAFISTFEVKIFASMRPLFFLQTFCPVATPLLLIRVSAQEPSALSAASPCNYIRVSQFSIVKLDFCPSVSITAPGNPEGQVDVLKNYILFLTFLSF